MRPLPLRVRLVAAFAGVMLAVLAGAGAFVYWRVQVALDRTLDGDLAEQARALQQAWARRPDPQAAVAALRPDALGQLVSATDGTALATTAAARDLVLLPSRDLPAARRAAVRLDPGNVLTSGRRRLRGTALPLGGAVVAVTAVRIGQRDEALRELLGQLALANVLALAAASAVAYRVARGALLPVERYRARAAQIAEGATGVRLDVPAGVDDEVSRLGHTLNAMLAAQERSARQQQQFVADASHELRAPLTVLTSEVELALRRPRTAQEHEATLQRVAQDAARLVRLADELLDLERAGAPPLAGSADALEVAGRAAASARVRLAGTPRQVRATGVPAPVDVPASALEQVLGNLAENAVVHGQGAVVLDVSVRAGAVLVAVHDDGPGPPEAFVPHAVERLRRADTARSTPGNGLGLAVVHALLTRYGGELRLCSGGRHHRYPPGAWDDVPCRHPAEGTTVTAVLPAAL